jgi:hypothetical protein
MLESPKHWMYHHFSHSAELNDLFLDSPTPLHHKVLPLPGGLQRAKCLP